MRETGQEDGIRAFTPITFCFCLFCYSCVVFRLVVVLVCLFIYSNVSLFLFDFLLKYY